MFNDVYFVYEELVRIGRLLEKLYDLDVICKPQQLDPELLETILIGLDESYSYLEDIITLFCPEDYVCPDNSRNALFVAQQRITLVQSDLRLLNLIKKSKDPCDLCYAEEVFVSLYQYAFIEFSVFYAALNFKNGGAKLDD